MRLVTNGAARGGVNGGEGGKLIEPNTAAKDAALGHHSNLSESQVRIGQPPPLRNQFKPVPHRSCRFDWLSLAQGTQLALNEWPATSERSESSGPRRDRTAGLVIANDALYQLSYGPVECQCN